MRKFSFIPLLVALLFTACGKENQKMPWDDDLGKEQQPTTPPAEGGEGTEEEPYGVGSPLALWSEGCLDIHTISTGRGECIFIIMPDGTSLVVDAGEFSRESSEYKNVLQRPDSSTRPTEVYAKYILHFLPKSNMIDYFNISHFHMDHMGNLEKEYKTYEAGDYILSGVTALYHHVRFCEVIDRAYPNFDTPTVESRSEAALANYIKFLDYNTKNSGLKASKFQLGATNQFAMRHNAAAYPNFKTQNICSNGCIWESGKSVNIYQGKTLNENMASSGFVIRYGKFDFLTAGDIGDYNDFEYKVAKVVGDVDAAKAHHHLSPHSMCEKAMEVLKPEVMPVTSFYVREVQPDKSKFGYLTEGGCNIFCTSVGESLLTKFTSDYAKCAATSGHIVIRVAPGGDEYSVYTLDDKDSKYRITKIDGPFKSK